MTRVGGRGDQSCCTRLIAEFACQLATVESFGYFRGLLAGQSLDTIVEGLKVMMFSGANAP